ncbi:ribonuclease T2 [Sanghuangporus baumii]|uniref:ribonuclease T2 n=1 Tax=Sanghuangporus baumii TaxID=108892 RepID=A0A9Q5HXU1_SANBA|nr:ribonuclease T2 [Sanghuangporus baumii]
MARIARLFQGVVVAALFAVVVARQFSLPSTIPSLTSCLTEPVFYSCENTTTISDACCSPTPGGLVLQTQFWDTYTGLEKQGQLLPRNSWTIHGLWPDFCDGSFTQYCDLSRQYDPTPSPNTTNGLPNGTVVPSYSGPGVDTFILEFGRIDLLDYMNKYWISQGSPNKDFWAHEFSKHATCTSTFDVACYENYQAHEDVVNFFDTTVRAFQMFPTFDMLAAAGIVPSNSTTYTLSQIQTAIKIQTGATPFVGCGGNGTVLNEMWYFAHVLGTEQYGHFKPVESTTDSTCKNSGIRYLERTPTSEREVRVFP